MKDKEDRRRKKKRDAGRKVERVTETWIQTKSERDGEKRKEILRDTGRGTDRDNQTDKSRETGRKERGFMEKMRSKEADRQRQR